MSGVDLQDLLILIDNYYIELRDRLGIDRYITFGMELECESTINTSIYKKLSKNGLIGGANNWKISNDFSLNDDLEIKSPVLSDTEVAQRNLDKVCSILESSAKIGKKSGGHIHVGAHLLGNNKESWLNFIKIWSVYENIIFRFCYGGFLTARPYIVEYAEPMSKVFWTDYEKYKECDFGLPQMILDFQQTKYQAVNFNNVLARNCNKFYSYNTIEFRCPNGSLNPVIWQNNLNLFVKLLKYSKDSSFNDDIVSKRHNLNLNKFSELKFYDNIYLEQALELCDMIFTNNYDKVYFLRQYLKSFDICKSPTNYQKSKTFTKK